MRLEPFQGARRACRAWADRQRHSEFIGLSVEQLERLAKDKRTATAVRLKAIAELKYEGRRNRQKRSK